MTPPCEKLFLQPCVSLQSYDYDSHGGGRRDLKFITRTSPRAINCSKNSKLSLIQPGNLFREYLTYFISFGKCSLYASYKSLYESAFSCRSLYSSNFVFHSADYDVYISIISNSKLRSAIIRSAIIIFQPQFACETIETM